MVLSSACLHWPFMTQNIWVFFMLHLLFISKSIELVLTALVFWNTWEKGIIRDRLYLPVTYQFTMQQAGLSAREIDLKTYSWLGAAYKVFEYEFDVMVFHQLTPRAWLIKEWKVNRREKTNQATLYARSSKPECNLMHLEHTRGVQLTHS